MARIMVMGYLDTDDLPGSFVDLDHKTGLSEEGYQAITDPQSSYKISDLSDASFVRE